MYRYVSLGFILLLLIFTIAASSVSGSSWIIWLSLLVIALSLYIFDLVFNGDGKFLFDPFYANFVKATQPRY